MNPKLETSEAQVPEEKDPSEESLESRLLLMI